MQQVSINKQEFAVGLNWQPLAGEEKRAREIKLLASQVGHDYGVFREGESGAEVGFSKKALSGMYSAAALLARFEKNILLVEQVAQDRFWLCFIHNGLVMPGGDFVGPIENTKARFNEHLGAVYMNETAEVKICAPGLTDEFAEAEDVGFAELTGSEDPGKQEKIGRVANKAVSAPVIAVIFVLLVLGAYFGVKMKGQSEDITPLPPMVNKKDKMSLEEIKKKALIEEIDRMRQTLSLAKASENISVLQKYISLVSLHSNGWEATRFKLDPEEKSFKVRWVRESGLASVDSFRRTFQSSSLVYALDGESIVESTRIDLAQPDNGVDVVDLLQTAKGSYVRLISEIQRAPGKMIWSVKEQKQGPRFAAIKGLQGADAKIPQLKYKKYYWEISGAGAQSLRRISEKLAHVPTLVPEEIVVTRETGIRDVWVLKAVSYEGI